MVIEKDNKASRINIVHITFWWDYEKEVDKLLINKMKIANALNIVFILLSIALSIIWLMNYGD